MDRKKIKNISNKIVSSLSKIKAGFVHNITKKPVLSFSIAIFLLTALILGSNLLYKPTSTAEVKTPIKNVAVYRIGKAPRLNFQAKIEKKGVTTIAAQSGGIVQNIYYKEGDSVNKGVWIVGLSTNYQGGNVASLQRQIAQKQFDTINSSYDTQKDIIAKQRDLANKSNDNSDEIRSLTDQALSGFRDQLSLNEDILNTVNTNLDVLEKTNTNGNNETLILQTKQLKGQYMAAVDQLESTIRTSEYQIGTDNPPSQLVDLNKDIALKQLDLQEKALDLSKEVSGLSLKIAQISESLMYPSTPFSGKIEKIYVRTGQLISPGTPLALLSGTTQNNVAVVSLSASLAKPISKLEPSTVVIGNHEVQLLPSYVSQEATDGQLYSVFYTLPNEYCSDITDGQYLSVSIPIGYPDTGSTIPYVPIDVISQTQEETILYVAANGKAEYRKIEIGDVFGRFVEVTKGLNNGDVVILDRTVVSGDSITYEN